MVIALLMLVVDLSFAMMNIDIVAVSKLPVAMLGYNYRRAFFITERAYSTTVNGIAPSNPSRSKIGLKRIYFNSGHTAEAR